jgi:hypothetical protein
VLADAGVEGADDMVGALSAEQVLVFEKLQSAEE